MAKGGPLKGQQSITSFFGGGSSSKPAPKVSKAPKAKPRKVTKPAVDEDDDVVDLTEEKENLEPSGDGSDTEPPADDAYEPDEDDDQDEEAPEGDASDVEMATEETYKKGRTFVGAPELPPIHDIPSIFADMVRRFPKIQDVVQHMKGRKMRVATMCSGTESPLLALDLIRRGVLHHYGVNLEFEHVFSCEIVPFKQAYIERNFQPPLLFRDVTELGNTYATTAYGSKALVPGDVDILIAGTSCVDFSNLNNEKQELHGRGESGRTFRGMMSWVQRHRPPIVLLENVCSAPWKDIVNEWHKNKYSAEQLRVDTKLYYIPHTRMRGYLFAVDQKNSPIPAQWKDMLLKLQRPASSTLDAFLLPSDDPRIHQAREKLVRETDKDTRAGRTDWSRCENRHRRARLEEKLGNKRPLTGWDEAGTCKLPDYAWQDWGVQQVERVWDLLDISLMRAASKNVDPSYKTQVWNLSQNVDRSTGSSKVGICPCLTPSMIPYITNRGGPMVGIEALSLQGLPVDELLLTRETEDQLADLAGNAMSSTVVGACILAALVSGKGMLKSGDDERTYEEKKATRSNDDEEEEDDEGAMDVNEPLKRGDVVEDHIVGGNRLEEQPLDLAATSEGPLDKLLASAMRSIRYCICEGRKGITNRGILHCQDCDMTVCVKCGGRPEHNYQPLNFEHNPRLHPSAFERELKSVLPMSLEITGVTQELLDALKKTAGVDIDGARWSKWSDAILRATGESLRFAEPKRQQIWFAIYQSSSASLELCLRPQQVEWRLFAKPLESEPANADIREILETYPVARFVCEGGLLEGHWEVALPHRSAVNLTVKGGNLVPCWQQKMGMVGDEWKDKMVHSTLEVSVPAEHVDKLERNISGTYTLFDKCGAPRSYLFKRNVDDADEHLPPIYFFPNPGRCTDPKDDGWAFSVDNRRYEYGEKRPLILEVDSKWDLNDKDGAQTVRASIPSRWVNTSDVKLKPSNVPDAVYATPGKDFQMDISAESCGSATALLSCRVPLDENAGPEWSRGAWTEVDRIHERHTFRALAWLLERVKNVGDLFGDWQNAALPDTLLNCERCAPSPPQIRWSLVNEKKIVAVEDTAQAGAYERALKSRPAAFVTQLMLDNNNVGTVRIGVNIASLMHRALSRLPTAGRTQKAAISWRLDTDYAPMPRLSLPKYTIPSNRDDALHSEPPSFKVPLRPEQLRSLTWMLARESTDTEPFIEEEISEAILDPLGWRAEGRAQRPVNIRGGVLADQVGYGKTAITLALIDCTKKQIQKEHRELEKDRIPGRIRVKASLVLVPGHLACQWPDEISKFLGKSVRVETLMNQADINRLTTQNVMDADILVVAQSVYNSPNYLANLAEFAGGPSLPNNKPGRFLEARLDAVHEALQKQVDRLRDEGAAAAWDHIERTAKKDVDKAFFLPPPTKRLVGKKYREAAVTKEKPSETEVKPSTKAGKAKPLNGMVMEVVVSSKAPSKKAGPASSSDDAAKASASTDSRPKRQTKARPIVISDDEQEASEYGKAAMSSDYEAPPATDSDDDMEVDASEDEDEPKKSKGKGKASAKGKSKAPPKAARGLKSKASSTGDSDFEMDDDDDDEPAPKGKAASKGKGKAASNSKKRKSPDDSDDSDRPNKKVKAAPKARRYEKDPWRLKTAAVRRDFTEMKAPPLEMFHFSRKIIDEYTYISGVPLAMINRISADRQWILSGTPPVHDFKALKSISSFLGVHLGIDDDPPEKPKRGSKSDRTAVEEFHSFREVHSLEWHAHRHEIGQAFLNKFVRQNVAEIGDIPTTEHIRKVELPAAERAIYLELEHHLRAMDMMVVRKNRKSESDREKRFKQVLGESKSAEEALIKRCSHFDLDSEEADKKDKKDKGGKTKLSTENKENAMKACDIIVKERERQLEDCKADFLKHMKEAFEMENKAGKTEQETLFREYVRTTKAESVGDADATNTLRELIEQARQSAKSDGGKGGKVKQDDLLWELREKTHDIRRIEKELIGRVRSLRYFTMVRDLQKQDGRTRTITCPACGRDDVGVNEIAILSSCGHAGCYSCVRDYADREECTHAASSNCRAAARALNIVRGETLGIDDVARDGRGKHYGRKLEEVIKLIKKEIPKDERVLLFVQFGDLVKKVKEAFVANDVSFLEISGGASSRSKSLQNFQKNSKERVLILNVMDESASGANLTIANHAIFLSPLLTETQERYEATETQAIGRVRRYGQTKHVHIYRFFSLDTIDVEIFEQRTGMKVTRD